MPRKALLEKIHAGHFSTVLFLLLCVGCERTAPVMYTEADVRRVVVPGVTSEDVDKAFGPPYLTLPGTGDVTVAYHSIPRKNLPTTFEGKFTGFQVHYSGGRALRWLPIYSDRGLTQSSPQAVAAGRPATGLRFAVAKESPFENAVHFSTPELGDVGYISNVPDLSISRVHSVSRGSETTGNAASPRLTPTLVITLEPADGASLEAITKTNLGNRMLIAAGTNTIAAPYIRTPIGQEEITLTFRDEAARDHAFEALSASSTVRTKRD